MQWPSWKKREEKDRWGGSAPVAPSAKVKPVERIVSSAPVRPSAAVKPVESQARVMDERGLQNSTFQIPDSKVQISDAKPLPQASQAGDRTPLTRDEVTGMIERAIPAFLRQMSMMPPTGDLSRAFIGFIGSRAGWREMEDGPAKDVPDANTPFDDVETDQPIRKTLERNPEENDHQDELQLYGVDNVPVDTGTMPYFDASTETPIRGELKWAKMDSQNPKTTPTQKSLEVKAAVLQVHGVDLALDQQAMVVDAYGSLRKTNFAYPALLGGLPYLTASGAGPVGAEQKQPYLVSVAFSADGTELLITQYVSNIELADGRLNLTGISGASEALRVDLNEMGIVPGAHMHTTGDVSDWTDKFRHDELLDMPSDENADHDGRYWRAEEKDPLSGPTASNFATEGDVKAGKIWLGGREMEIVRLAVVDPNTGESTEREVLAVKL
jgi:hypothetical protein